MKKRVLGLIMALAMALSLFPMTALAVPMDEAWIDHADTNWYSNNNSASEFTISTAAQLAGLAQLVNEGNNFSGKTITLGANIDLAGKEWTPIGTSGKPFSGTFDGKNFIIYNLVITNPSASDVGLFGYTTKGEIKEFTLKNAKVTGYLDVGAVCGTPYTSKYTNISVTGLIQIKGFAYVGGALGKNAYANITNVDINATAGSYVMADSVDGSTAYRTYVGGLIGFMGEGSHSVSNCDVKIDVIGSTCDVGGILGILHYGNTLTNCTYAGSLTLTNPDADSGDEFGALVGVIHNGGSSSTMTKISDCSATVSKALWGNEDVTSTIMPYGDFYNEVSSTNNIGTVSVNATVNGNTIITDNNVATCNNIGYKSLSAAITAANSVQDTSSSPITVEITKSGNYDPFTITRANVTVQAKEGVTATINISENKAGNVNAGNVTLKNIEFVSKDGTTIFSGGSCDKLKLDGCTFTGNGTGTALYIHQPNITIKGCTFQNFERGYYTCGDNHAAGAMTFTRNTFTNVRVPIDGYWGKPATDDTNIQITNNTFNSGDWDAAYIQLWDYAQYQYWLKGNSSTLNPAGKSAINATIENNTYQGNVVIYATHFDWFSESKLTLGKTSNALVKYRYLVELENAASATVRNADGSEITAFNESTASSSRNGKTVIYSICEGDYIFDIKPAGSTEAVLSQKVTVAKPKANSTNKVTVSEDAANVAQIGNQTYTSLAEALAAAQAGDTVELLSNVEVDTWNQVWNLQGITLDGNGYTLTIKNIASGQNHNAVFHSAGGNTFQDLTIDLSGLESASLAQGSRAFSAAAGDTYKNITILGNKNLSYGMTASGTNVEDETITIDGCTFENCGYGIYDDESGAVENLVITNSSFTGCEYATILRGANSSFTDNTVSGGRLNVMQDGQTVTGNTFTDSSLIKFYANGAQFEQNKISQDSRLDFGDSFTGRLDVSHNYWGGGAPTEEQLGSSENVTGNDVYYIRDTMRDQDLNTYIPPDTTPYYTITVKDAENGTVTCYAKSAAKGADVTLTVKSNVGYQLDKLTVTDASGNVIDVEKVNNTTYTFVMPGSKVTVEAVFAPTSVEPSDLPFTDVSTSDWFYSTVPWP